MVPQTLQKGFYQRYHFTGSSEQPWAQQQTVKGETKHNEYLSATVINGLRNLSLEYKIPILNSVIINILSRNFGVPMIPMQGLEKPAESQVAQNIQGAYYALKIESLLTRKEWNKFLNRRLSSLIIRHKIIK